LLEEAAPFLEVASRGSGGPRILAGVRRLLAPASPNLRHGLRTARTRRPGAERGGPHAGSQPDQPASAAAPCALATSRMFGEALVRRTASGVEEVDMSWYKGILQILILRCEASAELSSRELDEPLGKLERMALYGHLLLCGSCRRFHQQLELIRAAIRLRETRPSLTWPDAGCLSDAARERIARAIRQAAGDEADYAS